MSKLITSSPSRKCDVCFDDTGKCRHGHEINLCMLFADAKIGEIINGYKLLKHSKDGMWGVFKIDNTQEWSEQQREQWRLDTERRKQQQKLEDNLRQKQSLSVIEKDKQYQRVFDELTLHPEDEKELLRRGFTHREIELGGWKSVDRYHELKQKYSNLLPGISPDGQVILTNSGWLCPVRNKDGLIVGIQVRLRVVPIGEGRYRWLSSKTKQNPNGQSPHVYPLGGNDGELPLASFYPEGEPKGIALAEGVGVKPFYVAQRLGMLTLGAAGGQWASSPVTFKESLDHFSKKMDNLKSITIYVDAGDVLNKLVVGRWKKTVRLLQEWDWTVRIAWWGQITKEHGDIDEISSTEIQYISAKEFFAIADQQLKLVDQQKQTANKAREKRNEIEQLTATRQRLTHITETPYRVVNEPHMGEVLKDLIEPGTVNIIISDTGTGKTESVKPFADKSEAFYSWHNRRSLGRKMSSDLGLNYKDNISSNGQKKKAAFCNPSAYQFEAKNLSNGGVLLFDECDQVFDFNFGSLCNKDGIRPLILATLEAHFQSAIAGNGIVLCMSADTTQKEIDYIKAVTPEGTPVRLIINKYQPKRPDINLDTSPSPEGLLDLLLENLKAGIPCFVLDDMKDGVKGCKSIAEYVRQELKDIRDLTLEIHSDSMDDPNVKEFVQSADKKSEQYRFVVTSPSIISGLSLKNQRFVNGVFAFCNGILGDREIKQFLNRVRGAEDIYMWIAESGYPPRGVNPDLVTPQEIHDYYQRNYAANSKHILSLKTDYDPMTNEWTSPHFELFVKNLSYKLMTMKHLRHFTIEHLKEIGYGIIEQQFIPSRGTKEITEKLNHIWGTIDLQEAEAIASARILSDAEMEEIQHSAEDIPPELKRAYLKTRMLQTFGQELIDATTFEHKSGKKLKGFAAMALKNKRGEYARHLENFYLLNQDIGEAIARDYGAEARQLKVSGERFAGDIRWNASKRKGWEFLGLREFLKPEQWWEPKDYEEMGNEAKRYAHRVQDVLGFKVENITNGQIFGEFMHRIALELEKKKADGQKWKYRRISPDSWKFAQMYLAHKEAIKVKEPVPEVKVVPEIDPMVLMLIDYLPQAKTREQCEQLFITVSEQQKNEAWAMLAQEEQQRISALFEIQAIQPTIFEQVLLLDPVEVSADVDIEQSQQLLTLVEKAIAIDPPVENQQPTELVIEKLLKMQSQVEVATTQLTEIPTTEAVELVTAKAMKMAMPEVLNYQSSVELVVAKLRQVSQWTEVNLSQSEINRAWPLLTKDEQLRLCQLHQECQQPSSLEELAQEAIANQKTIKEKAFGVDHFRSYILKAVRGGIAIARKCWGDKQECEIPLNQLLLATG